MGRLVWFGVIALSPGGAVAALALTTIALIGTGYAIGRHKHWPKTGARPA